MLHFLPNTTAVSSNNPREQAPLGNVGIVDERTKGERRAAGGRAAAGARERSLVFCPITCNTGCDFFLVSGEWRRG